MKKGIVWAMIYLAISLGLASCGSSTNSSTADTSTSSKAITEYFFSNPPAVSNINESDKTIVITVPYGTDVKGLIASFTTSGASVKVGGALQASGATANNFTSSVVYSVTAADGSTANYTVTVTVALDSSKTMTSFSILGIPGTINVSTKTIILSVPHGTDVTALTATFTTTGTIVNVSGAVQVSGTTANNFTSPVVYSVTAADGSTTNYTVTVSIALNSAKAITSFSVLGIHGSIIESAKTVTLSLPFGTNVTGLIAIFTTTGVSVTVGGTVQVSGTTVNDFTNPVIYTVNAADGSITQYTVSVTVLTASSVPLTWTWVGGSNTINQSGVYGTKGLDSASNFPGARELATACTDTNGNLWLFGGSGYEATGGGVLNDLWKFDGTNWTWVSGFDTGWHAGIYGTMGIASASNVPGDRAAAVSWCDKNGNFWLYGGNGLDSLGNQADLNDLWKFDGTNWTWMRGANTVKQASVYGTRGTVSPSNVPGARSRATSWTDSNGGLWLFGGAYNPSPFDPSVEFNDLWKFDGTHWTWVSGSNSANQNGNYGTKWIAAASNTPGARYDSIAWMDQSGNLWLFGGTGYDSAGNGGALNDLWKFDGTNWTWVSGSNTVSQSGVYGTKTTASTSNSPGARRAAPGVVDNSGNFWLFGGYGLDSQGNSGYLSDLWKFDGTNWTWIGGPDTVDQPGVYGTQSTASASNIPQPRNNFVSWTDKNGNFWLFGGGTGYYSDVFNDLWFFDVP